jgi:hypothetical protein
MVSRNIVGGLSPGQTFALHANLKESRNHARRNLDIFRDLPGLVEQVLNATHCDVLQRRPFLGLSLCHFNAGLSLGSPLQLVHVQVVRLGTFWPIPLRAKIS